MIFTYVSYTIMIHTHVNIYVYRYICIKKSIYIYRKKKHVFALLWWSRLKTVQISYVQTQIFGKLQTYDEVVWCAEDEVDEHWVEGSIKAKDWRNRSNHSIGYTCGEKEQTRQTILQITPTLSVVLVCTPAVQYIHPHSGVSAWSPHWCQRSDLQWRSLWWGNEAAIL